MAGGLFYRGEFSRPKLPRNKPVTLVVSANNPGADRVAGELKDRYHGITIKSAYQKGKGGFMSRKSFMRPSGPAAAASETQLLVLYLNKRTFLDEAGEQLAVEVREVQQLNPRAILLLHENDHALGGCEFGR